MKKCVALLCLVGMLLSGCGHLMNGRYVSIIPYVPPETPDNSHIPEVSDYQGLVDTLLALVHAGEESGLISVANYDQAAIDGDMADGIRQVLTLDPIGAYAVSEMTYDVGTSGGAPAVAIAVRYLHDRTELRRIRYPGDWEQTEEAVSAALNDCDSMLVLYLRDYTETDFAQWVTRYAAENPEKVVENPAVVMNVYPEDGPERVVELKFTYQNDRDALKKMQEAVARTFSAATILTGGEVGQMGKAQTIFSLLLMGLPQQFRLETSMTPAYSLLEHGVGDSRAFATVYAAMCARAGVECLTVTGNGKNGEPWFWNIVNCDGSYCHVNIVECCRTGEIRMADDEEMKSEGYVWDYGAYPACETPA